MTVLIRNQSIVEGWRSAATHLVNSPGTEETNLILCIDNPRASERHSICATDPRQVHRNGEDPRNVANTIFPERTWKNSTSRDDFYRRYERAHERGGKKSWGTYFLRLIRFGEQRINQLERAVEVINGWQNNPRTAIVFHLTSPETDRPRPLGGPCLQLCQLVVTQTSISIVAYYRNHDYFNKALPNFLGLFQLSDYIAKQTNRTTGDLVCHSAHAYSSGGKAALRALIEVSETADVAR